MRARQEFDVSILGEQILNALSDESLRYGAESLLREIIALARSFGGFETVRTGFLTALVSWLGRQLGLPVEQIRALTFKIPDLVKRESLLRDEQREMFGNLPAALEAEGFTIVVQPPLKVSFGEPKPLLVAFKGEFRNSWRILVAPVSPGTVQLTLQDSQGRHVLQTETGIGLEAVRRSLDLWERRQESFLHERREFSAGQVVRHVDDGRTGEVVLGGANEVFVNFGFKPRVGTRPTPGEWVPVRKLELHHEDDHSFCRALLREVMKTVERVTTPEERKAAHAYRESSGLYAEFWGPNGFYWHGRADCLFEAKAKGWQAWLEKFHPEMSESFRAKSLKREAYVLSTGTRVRTPAGVGRVVQVRSSFKSPFPDVLVEIDGRVLSFNETEVEFMGEARSKRTLDHVIDLMVEGVVPIRDFLQAKIHETFTVTADRLAQSGELSREERIELSGLIGDVLGDFNDDFPEFGDREIEVELDLPEGHIDKNELYIYLRERQTPYNWRGKGCLDYDDSRDVCRKYAPGFPREESQKHESTKSQLKSWYDSRGEFDVPDSQIAREILQGFTSAAEAGEFIQDLGPREIIGYTVQGYEIKSADVKWALSILPDYRESFDAAIDLLLEGQSFDEIVSLLTVPLAGTGLEKLPGQVGGLFKKGAAAVKAADVRLKPVSVGKAVKKGIAAIKECPKGQERNPTTGACEPIECPEGYFLDKETGTCVMRTIEKLKCPEGKYYDPEKERCIVPVDPKTKKAIKCPEGQEWEPKANACLPEYDAVAKRKKAKAALPEPEKEPEKKIEPPKEPKAVEPKKEPKLLPPAKRPDIKAVLGEPKKPVQPGQVPGPGQRCPRGYHKNPKTGACEPREAASMIHDRGWLEWSLRKRLEQFLTIPATGFVTVTVSDPGMATVLLDQAGIENFDTDGAIMVRQTEAEFALQILRNAGIEVIELEARRHRVEQEKPEIDIEALAEKLGVKADQLAAGIEVEKEHSDTVGGDIKTIIAIAVDHLAEDPDYYTKLAEMEAGFEEEPDEEVEQAITTFLSQNPNPSDDEIHALAEKLDVEPDELEEVIYAMLGEKLAESYRR